MSEDFKKILGFSWDPGCIPSRESLPVRGTKEALFRLKKILPEFVFRDAYLEGNPLTYPEVKTLLDGVSVGGRKISDVEQVLNLRNAWNRAETLLSKNGFSLSKEIFCEINGLVAQNEALTWGEFRTENVGIGGTSWVPPDWQTLPDRFERGIEKVLRIDNPLERPMTFSLWTAREQFFFDGNKRTGRIMMSGELIKNGLDALSIPNTSRQTFSQLPRTKVRSLKIQTPDAMGADRFTDSQKEGQDSTSLVDQGLRRKPLRYEQVVKTHRRMLPQFAALKGPDHAGERQSAEGSDRRRKAGAGS